jgi:histidine triad (HIT) family protein
MSDGECIFCKIIKKEIPAKIVHESENCIAILDINPRSKGMCLVIPNQHFLNFDEDFELASKTFDDALIVAEKIKKALQPEAVFISMLPGQVPHFHLRVYPVYKDQIPLFENKPIEITEEELNSLAEKIKSVEAEWKGRKIAMIEEPKKEKKEEVEEKKRDEEEVYWMKRSWEIG